MCYICSCFSSALDCIQRSITFALTCILSCAVCFGLTLAIVAGIAYGYNYSMAEFITFTRSDVTVFMRRGQFYDKPDLPLPRRRTGESEEELFSNRTDNEQGEKRLADTWLKSQDTRNYAEKLTKYSPPKGSDVQSVPVLRAQEIAPIAVESMSQATAPPPQLPQIYHQLQKSFGKIPESDVISVAPNMLIPTLSWPSGSSQIVMRNFKPLDDINIPTMSAANTPEDQLSASTDLSLKSLGFVSSKQKTKGLPAHRRAGASKQGYIPMRVWTTSRRPVIPDYVTEEIDEDNIVYKPV
ncbi:uncharacterized protein LOC142977731 [Anticarsia gemmatalis]|uniref:uncharacterized protein LOC142977731 n=1 Tax=Anticarsia gemmatalis TaxID=129554 RepID=UPI003F77615C